MASNISLNIYYPLPKMNPKNLFHLTPLYSSEADTVLSNNHNSVDFLLKDFQEHSSSFTKKHFTYSFKKNWKSPPISSTANTSITNVYEIEKEWEKLSPLLVQLHLVNNLLNFLPNIPIQDSSWNYIHYFPLISSTSNSYSKVPIYSTGLFLLPNSFYFSNLQSADLVLSLYELTEEQTVYLVLFSLLVQNPKGSFVLKLKYFYTSLMMDILYLLSSVYNKVILLPLDYVNFYVICKGFQIDFVKPHYTQLRNILYTLRPNSLQRIVSKYIPSRRIFSTPLPSLFVSKIEEINVLIHHKQLMYLNN